MNTQLLRFDNTRTDDPEGNPIELWQPMNAAPVKK